MPSPETEPRILRFGSYEADLKEARLTKSGVRIRLQEQPFQILILLLERAGQVVTRDEIREKLWSDNTFVEFDNALNTAVGKLRAALNDSAENPRFLETVPRRGYRFVAPVAFQSELVSIPPKAQPTRPEAGATSASETSQKAQHRTAWRRFVGIATAILVFIGTVAAHDLRSPPQTRSSWLIL
jgi:DNA-binding winged helix-turn-helix (wHTH) protein